MIQEKESNVNTVIICEKCGQIITGNVYETASGHICDACRTRYEYLQCEECELWFSADEIGETRSGNLYCLNCLSDMDYQQCEDCGFYEDTNVLYIVNSGTRREHYVCFDCLSDYIQCEECGEYYSDNYIFVDNNDVAICNDCERRYGIRICNNCGNWIIPADNAIYTDDDNVYCSNECMEECEGIDVIHHYHDGPPINFLKSDKDKPLSYDMVYASHVYKDIPYYRYFGIELEVDRGNSEGASEVLEALGGEDKAYLEHDGSLGPEGFEIISQPMTANYMKSWLDKYMYKAIKVLRHYRYLSHNTTTCGLHFHISRNTLAPDTIDKMVITADKFSDFLLKISRRKSWNRFIHDYKRLYSTDDTAEEIAKTLKGHKKATRYFIVNDTNSDTVEIRLFKGTLNLGSIHAAFEFVQSFIEWAEEHTEAEILSSTVDDFKHWLFCTEDGHALSAYLATRLNKENTTENIQEEE